MPVTILEFHSASVHIRCIVLWAFIRVYLQQRAVCKVYYMYCNKSVCTTFVPAVRLCPAVPEASNATVDSEVIPVFGVTVTYTCYHGYQLPNGRTIQTISCNQHGNWTRQPTACQGMLNLSSMNESLRVRKVSGPASGTDVIFIDFEWFSGCLVSVDGASWEGISPRFCWMQWRMLVL